MTEKIDASTPGGKLIFPLMGALTEFERDLIRERTNAGLSAARARTAGRPRKLKTDQKIALARRMLMHFSGICVLLFLRIPTRVHEQIALLYFGYLTRHAVPLATSAERKRGVAFGKQTEKPLGSNESQEVSLFTFMKIQADYPGGNIFVFEKNARAT